MVRHVDIDIVAENLNPAQVGTAQSYTWLALYILFDHIHGVELPKMLYRVFVQSCIEYTHRIGAKHKR